MRNNYTLYYTIVEFIVFLFLFYSKQSCFSTSSLGFIFVYSYYLFYRRLYITYASNQRNSIHSVVYLYRVRVVVVFFVHHRFVRCSPTIYVVSWCRQYTQYHKYIYILYIHIVCLYVCMCVCTYVCVCVYDNEPFNDQTCLLLMMINGRIYGNGRWCYTLPI